MEAPNAFRAGDVVTIRDNRWRVASAVTHGQTAVVQAVGCDAVNRAERASFLLPFESCTRVEATRPRVVTPRRWRHVARAVLAAATPCWSSLRSAADADFSVLPYQLEPALAMVRGDATRFLIADAVGLGKTVQAGLMIAELVSRQVDARAIVICPAGLRDQWCDELRRRFCLDARIIDAASMARMTRELPPHVNPWSTQTVGVTSIDYLKRPEVIRGLEGLVWDMAVFDEAHNLATHSDRATAASLVAERARQVVLLTATPHSGDDDSFARLCGLGQLGTQDKLLVFRRSRRAIGIDDSSSRRFIHVQPTKAERAMHDALLRYARQIWRAACASPGARLAASVLARRACSSAASLARSVERRLALLSGAQDAVVVQPGLPFDPNPRVDDEPDWQLSAPGLADVRDECRQLEAILQCARSATAHESKVAALQRLLDRIDEPAIVFTEYRDTLARLATWSGASDALQLHGGLTAKERTEVVRQFTRGSSQLLLATDAGSEGLNLHHRCRLVISLELPWMPRRLEQRGGRVDRIGQSRRVHVLSLVARNTCEEQVLARLTLRGIVAAQTMDLFSPGTSEERVAATVLGDEQEQSDVGTSAPLPPEVVRAHVPEAGDEATRIERSRSLRDHAAHVTEVGSILTRIRRRRRRGGVPNRFWLFTFSCCSEQEQLVWQPVVAIRACIPGRTSGTPGDTRLLLDPLTLDITGPLRRHIDGFAKAVSDALTPAARRWVEREKAIIERLRERQARMSATLLQPGLFDRRADRLASEYQGAQEQALARSSVRIAHVSALTNVTADAPRLVFGLLLE